MPFILKAGKALNERKVEIRLQMRPTVANLWHEEDPNALRNELVVCFWRNLVHLHSCFGFGHCWIVNGGHRANTKDLRKSAVLPECRICCQKWQCIAGGG